MVAPKTDSAARVVIEKADADGETSPTAAAPAATKALGGLRAWLPTIACVVLAPIATGGAVEFVLLPRLQKKIAATPAGEHVAPAAEPAAGHGAKGKGKDG